jgi:catechol 2,3-dioxygenase-like lactoylglutathione lyase family enzyme
MDNKIPNSLTFSPAEKSDTQPHVRGLQEVVFSVQNLDRAIDFYQKAVGWSIAYRGMGKKQQKKAWNLPPQCAIEECVLFNEGDAQGFLRLVCFKNVPQRQIRSSGRVWDIGGIFDVDMRVKDLAEQFKQFQAEGWNGFGNPVRYQFAQFDVSEILMQGHDGVVVALIQRHAPPLEGYPNLRQLSFIFNSTQVVKDLAKSYDFWVNQLGFKIVMHHVGVSSTKGTNVLGLPHNWNDKFDRELYIVHPEGKNLGSVELLQFKNVVGEDFTEYAVPPNLGILLLRFPVSNAVLYADLLKKRGLSLEFEPVEVTVLPYGKVKIFGLRSPDGAWIEFLEKI